MNAKHRLWHVITFLAPLSLIGCASTGKSVGAGAAAGAVLGAGVGALADPDSNGNNRFRNVVIGTAIGSAAGAGAGFMKDRHLTRKKEEAFGRGKKEASREAGLGAMESDVGIPMLLPAKTEARWVPDQIRGKVFIPGHFEYVITEGARWSVGNR